MSDDHVLASHCAANFERIASLIAEVQQARARSDDLRDLLAARARRAASQGRPIDDDLYLCHWHPWEETERIDWATEGLEQWMDGDE